MKRLLFRSSGAFEKTTEALVGLAFFMLAVIYPAALADSAENKPAPFVPDEPTLSVYDFNVGDRGYMLTVKHGMKPEKIPIEISGKVIAEDRRLKSGILIKLLGDNTLAQGMSGSPVYIRGKLIGGVSSGWELSSHKVGVVTPIDFMCNIFNEPSGGKNVMHNGDGVIVSGINNDENFKRIGMSSGSRAERSFVISKREIELTRTPFRPGESISVLLVWGDVEVSTMGTVTAVSKDGRFIAFGHPFMKRGHVAFPAARAYVHDTVDSLAFPFKLSSPLSVCGTIEEDRENGIGGRIGAYARSIPAELVFHDLDRDRHEVYRFRVVDDDFLSPRLLKTVYTGLVEEAWGRRGQGTMDVTLRIEGGGVKDGWTRRDVYVSDQDIGDIALNSFMKTVDFYMTQPFEKVQPCGFRVEIKATEQLRVLSIDDVEVESKARPGEEVDVKVRLRPWRGEAFERSFKMRIPEDATGVSELVVRGGATQPMYEAGVNGGWLAITELGRLMEEFNASDGNNELILELSNDKLESALKKAKAGRDRGNSNMTNLDGIKIWNVGIGKMREEDLLPEEREYLSETKERRKREGTLRVYSSDYYVDGLLKRVIHVEK